MENPDWSAEKTYFFLKQFDLSPREIDVALALLSIKTDEAIGMKLNISKHTVHTHRKHIYEKTKTKDRSDLINFLCTNGLYKN